MLIIAGTGSIVYGRNEKGKTLRAGGWGPVISDEGSGDWIGRASVNAALLGNADGEKGALFADICKAWDAHTADDIIRIANSYPPPNFAALFPYVIDACNAGDQLAIEVIRRGGSQLGAIVLLVMRQLWSDNDPVTVATAGGAITNSERLRSMVENRILAEWSSALFRHDRSIPRRARSISPAPLVFRQELTMADESTRGIRHPHPARHAIVADSASQLEQKIHRQCADIEALRSAASHPALGEELALTLLERRELPSAVLDDLAKNGRVMKYRKVRLTVVQHPHTPRHVSLPLMRNLYTFELMNVALIPGVAADVKIAAEETLLSRFGTISAGEKLTLGKLGSARVAAGLLNDPDKRVVDAALDNPYLTEQWVIRAVLKRILQRYFRCMSAVTGSGQCVKTFVLRCYAMSSLRSLMPSSSRNRSRWRR